MSKVRVLRVQSRICVGGPALNTILLSAYLPKDRFETMLVGGRLEPDEKDRNQFAREKGVEIKIIEEMGRSVKLGDDWRALRRMMALIKEYKPHIVHTHTAKAGAIGRLAAFLCRVPLRVHTFHGHVFHGYFSALVSYGFVMVERVLSLMSHAIIAISPRQQRDLTRMYRVVGNEKCHVVRLGFELSNIEAGQPGYFRKKLGLGKDVKLAGIVARLAPIKNHALLLDAIAAWRKLPHHEDNVRFLIIGDGDLRQQLEQQARDLQIDDVVIFTGWQTDVADIYADLDLNLLVSNNEGTPVTLIEGLACGVPVLSTDVGGVRDFVEDHMGIIVSPGEEPDVIAGHIQTMLNRGRLSEEDRAQIRKGYDVSRLVSDVAGLYEELIKEKEIKISD